MKIILAFRNSRQSAVAMIFAIALIPLVLLVGLSIDYSFYAQARAQIDLAADAAASHAIRTAIATYTLETSEIVNKTPGYTKLNPTTDAKAAGDAEGLLWFNAQLATLPTSYISGGSPTVDVESNNVSAAPGAALPGFDANVTYNGLYPPFFGGLFNNTSKWAVTGSAGATSPFNYIEVDMLLDTSASMLIGANQSDILTLEENSVCPSTQVLTGSNVGYVSKNVWQPQISGNNTGEFWQGLVNLAPSGWLETLNDGIPTASYTKAAYSSTYGNSEWAGGGYPPGTCKSGYNPSGAPYAPCAFACHTDTGHYGAASQDLYGIARTDAAAVTLRLDVVLTATENIINSMITSQQQQGQFSVGVYRFDQTVFPVATGGSASDNDKVATTNLPTALSDVNAIDYTKNPSEKVLPSTVSYADDDTDFPLVMQNIYNGKSSQNVPQFTAAGDGTTPVAPLKNLFIVTDGMQDDGGDDPYATVSSRTNGTMTGVEAEQTNSVIAGTPALCGPLKQLGYRIYVLYITYYPLANIFYQTTNAATSPYFQQDFGNITAAPTIDFAENTNLTSGSANSGGLPPDVAALQACASSPADFYTATSTADINSAMNAMLEAALSTTVRITN